MEGGFLIVFGFQMAVAMEVWAVLVYVVWWGEGGFFLLAVCEGFSARSWLGDRAHLIGDGH